MSIDEELGGIELIEAAHPRPRFSRHAHPTFAIGVVSSGANRFRYRGAWHTAPTGSVCTVTPDEPHAVEPAGDLGFAYRCIYPSPELFRSVAEALGGGRVGRTLALPPVIEDAPTARLAAAFFDAEASGAPRLSRETHLFALLARLAARHALEPVVQGKPSRHPPGIARAREYLAAHLAENVPLAALAAVAGLEPFALLRGFSAAFGLPPHAWRVQERVRRAQALLRSGTAPAEAAAAVGFSDQSHLTRHFKRLLGFTPGRYRRAALAPASCAGPTT